MFPPSRTLLWLCAGCLSAQEPQAGFGDLKALLELRNTPVIAASKREQNLLDSPQAIEVITADQIRASGVFRLIDILKLATGVQVWDELPTRANVTLRGVNPIGTPRTLQVLVDGVPLYNFMASPLDFNGLPVPLDAIERVEIVRGPSSSLYGANAQTGVIAIITKRARPGLEGSARLGLGDHGTFHGELFASQGGPHFSLAISGSASSSRDVGHPIRVVGPSGATIPQDTANREQAFLMRPEWAEGPDRLWALAGYGDAGHFDEVSRSATSLAPLTILPDQSVRREILQAGWARTWNPDLKTEARLEQKVFRFRKQPLRALPGSPASAAVWSQIVANDPTFATDQDFFSDHVRQASLQANWTPDPAVHVVLGVDGATITSIPSRTLGIPVGRTERSLGGFGSLYCDVGAFTLSGGARAEHDSLGGSRISPRLSGAWHPDATSSLRLGYFTSSRSPNIQEKYSEIGDIPLLAYVQQQNPGIKAEEADSLELGYRWLGEQWSLDVTLFHTQLKRLISLRPTGATAGGKQIRAYQNNPYQVTDQGVEIALQGQLAQGWRMGFNLATADFKDPINDLDQQADYAPRLMANLWTRWQRGAWFGFLGLQHKGAYTAISPFGASYASSEVPATTQVQFNLGWRPLERVSLSLYGINATHETADTAPVAITNAFALRYTRREVGLQMTWRY